MAVFYTKSKNYEQQVAHASLYEVSPPLPMLSRGSLAAFDPRLGCDPHLRRSQRLLRVSCGSAGARSIILGPILSGRAADLSHSQPAWLSLLGRETNLAVCLSSRRLLWKTYDLPPGWVPNPHLNVFQTQELTRLCCEV